MGRWRARDKRAASILESALWWGVVPALAVWVLTMLPSDWHATRAAARGAGQRGTFTATHKECHKACTWYGDYVSSDSSTRFNDVLIDDGPSRVGDRLPALYEGETDPPKVYTADGSSDWVWVLVIAAIAVSYLVAWGVLLTSRARGLFNQRVSG